MKLSSNKSQFSTRDVLAHHLSFSLKHHSPNPPKHAPSSFRVSPQHLPFILKFAIGQQDSYLPKLTVGKYVKCCSVRTWNNIFRRAKPHPPTAAFSHQVRSWSRRARASLWKRCWHPILEICRAERINGSPLGQTDGRWRKWPLRGEEWMRWVGSGDGGEGPLSAGRSAGRRIEARSPSQERAAVNTRPQGGGSPRRARYLI